MRLPKDDQPPPTPGEQFELLYTATLATAGMTGGFALAGVMVAVLNGMGDGAPDMIVALGATALILLVITVFLVTQLRHHAEVEEDPT